MPATSLTPKATAALLRKVLKAAFPATKFGIRTERGSMVSSVRISWTDGPTTAEVDVFAGPFEMGRFDGMTDSYDYAAKADRQLLVDGVHYESGCKYVFTERAISPELANRCIKQIAEFWGGVEVVPVAVEGWRGYKFEDGSIGQRPVRADLDSYRNDWYTSIHRAASDPTAFAREVAS